MTKTAARVEKPRRFDDVSHTWALKDVLGFDENTMISRYGEELRQIKNRDHGLLQVILDQLHKQSKNNIIFLCSCVICKPVELKSG